MGEGKLRPHFDHDELLPQLSCVIPLHSTKTQLRLNWVRNNREPAVYFPLVCIVLSQYGECPASSRRASCTDPSGALDYMANSTSPIPQDYTLSPRRPRKSCASSVSVHPGPRMRRLSSVCRPVVICWAQGSDIACLAFYTTNWISQISSIPRAKKSVPRMERSTQRWRIWPMTSQSPRLVISCSVTL